MKIARGKVKEEEKYTCPICDWRVKIPRDAARPKLEELIAWQDEIANLPFQPDEEEILEKIINNAQDFRNHVAPYLNEFMATSEEADTQRFFLRKIEGAEILLSNETNFFRKQLHQWCPVAPEPPPMLEVSKSTRKPRPTKLQKLMAQHGVDDPEALPQSLRTKQHSFKRKSSEPQVPRSQPLQPAHGRSDSGTPTAHTFQDPASGYRGPVLSVGDGPPHHMMYDPRVYGMSSANQASTPAFAPHAYLHGGSQVALASPISSSFGTPSGGIKRESSIYTGAAFARNDPVVGTGLGSGLDSPMRDSFASASGAHSSSQGGIDRMFSDLTNQEDDGSGQTPSESKAPKSYTEATLEKLRESKQEPEPESEFLKQAWGNAFDED